LPASLSVVVASIRARFCDYYGDLGAAKAVKACIRFKDGNQIFHKIWVQSKNDETGYERTHKEMKYVHGLFANVADVTESISAARSPSDIRHNLYVLNRLYKRMPVRDISNVAKSGDGQARKVLL
jgi:hypothetical protein